MNQVGVSLVAAGQVRRLWKYIEAFWIRDRLGRWLKYIGPKSGNLWDTDAATGMERPNFQILDVYDRPSGTDPVLKGRLASEKLADGSVIVEVGRRGTALGRGVDPIEGDYDRISRDIPADLSPEQTAFVRVMSDLLQLSNDAAKMGGRARIQSAARQTRAVLSEDQPAGLDDVVAPLLDALDLLRGDAASGGRTVDPDDEVFLEDLIDAVDQAASDPDQAGAAERLGDALQFARGLTGDEVARDGIDRSIAALSRVEFVGPEEEYDVEGLADEFTDAVAVVDDAIGAAVEDGGVPVEAVQKAEELRDLLARAEEEFRESLQFDRELLHDTNSVAEYILNVAGWEIFTNAAKEAVQLVDRVTDYPDLLQEAIEAYLENGPDRVRLDGGTLLDTLSPDEAEAALQPDGPGPALVPASELPLWRDTFDPADLQGWSGNPDDPAVLYSDDDRLVLDADPASGAGDGRILVFDNATGEQRSYALDDPALDDVLAAPRAVPGGRDAFVEGEPGRVDVLPDRSVETDFRDWLGATDADPDSVQRAVSKYVDDMVALLDREGEAGFDAQDLSDASGLPVELADRVLRRYADGSSGALVRDATTARYRPGAGLRGDEGALVDAEEAGGLLRAGLGVDGYGQSVADYVAQVDAAAEAAGATGRSDAVGEALDRLDGVTDVDGGVSDVVDSAVLGDTSVALSDADAAVAESGDDSVAAVNLSGALEDAADVFDEAADVRAAREARTGDRPERVPLTAGPGAAAPIDTWVTDADLEATGDRGRAAAGRYDAAALKYLAALGDGDEEAASAEAKKMQQAMSDLAAEMLAVEDPQMRARALRVRAANRRLGAALRKAYYPKTKIDYRDQPKARQRRAKLLAEREQAQRVNAFRRASREFQRTNPALFDGLTDEQRAAWDGFDYETQAGVVESFDAAEEAGSEVSLGDLIDAQVQRDTVDETGAAAPESQIEEPEPEPVATSDDDVAVVMEELARGSRAIAGLDDARRARAEQIIRSLLEPGNEDTRALFDGLSPAQQRALVQVAASRLSMDPLDAFRAGLDRVVQQNAEHQQRYGLDNVLRDIERYAAQNKFAVGDAAVNDSIMDLVDAVRVAAVDGDASDALDDLARRVDGALRRANAINGVYDPVEVEFANRLQTARQDYAATRSAATAVSSTDAVSRGSVLDAIARSRLSDRTQQRAATALGAADITESVDADPAAQGDLVSRLSGGSTDPQVGDAVAQSGAVTSIGAPEGPVSVTASEDALASARAQQARDLARLPLTDQLAEIFSMIEGYAPLREKVDDYLYKRRGGDLRRDGSRRRVKMSRRDFLAKIAEVDDLDARKQQQIGNTLFHLRRYFWQNSYQGGDPEIERLSAQLADRTDVLLQSYLVQQGITLNPYTLAQDEEQPRIDRLNRIWNAAAPDPGSGWWYMDDYSDNLDYSPEMPNLQAALDRLGGDFDTVYTFSVDPSPETALLKARADLTGMIRQLSRNGMSGVDFQREEMFERVINHLNRVAGDGWDPMVAGVRDDLLALRDRVRVAAGTSSGGGTDWDLPDDVLAGVRDGLIRFMGANRGRIVRNAKIALDDALSAATVEQRWAALARARNALDLVHSRELVPAMNALRVRVDEGRLRDLGDVRFQLAPDNVPPARPAPRGAAWDSDDLGRLMGLVDGLREDAGGANAAGPQLQRKAADTLELAVRRYGEGQYGEFEQLLARALSRMVEAGDTRRASVLLDLRDEHWEPHDWPQRMRGLRAQIIARMGGLPSVTQIRTQDGDLLDPERNRQDGRALLTEALQRPDGSLEQRVHMAAALWFLNQADDVRDETMRDLLRPWDPNGDLFPPVVSPLSPLSGGSTFPPFAAGDTRVARAQQVARMLREDGAVPRSVLAGFWGVSPDQIDQLFDPLVVARVFRADEPSPDLGPGLDGDRLYFAGDLLRAVDTDGVPLTLPEWDAIIQRSMAEVTGEAPRVDPAEFRFTDPRVQVQPDGTVAAGDLITASWDEGLNVWSWEARGDDGQVVESGRVLTLDALDLTLSGAATRSGVPFPDVAVDEPDGDGEGPVEDSARSLELLAARVLSEVGATGVAELFDTAAQQVRDGSVMSARETLETASSALQRATGVVVGGDAEEYDPVRNLAVGELYADVRDVLSGLPRSYDLSGLARAWRGRQGGDVLRALLSDDMDRAQVDRVFQQIDEMEAGAAAAGDSSMARRVGALRDELRGVVDRESADFDVSVLSAAGEGLSEDRQALLRRAVDLAPRDPIGAGAVLRQVSLDVLERDGGPLSTQMVAALRAAERGLQQVRENYSYDNLFSRDPGFLSARSEMSRALQRGDARAQAVAAQRFMDTASVAALNPWYSLDQRRAFAAAAAEGAAAYDAARSVLAQIEAARGPATVDVVRRPSFRSPSDRPVVGGVALMPGDVVTSMGRSYLYQGPAEVGADGNPRSNRMLVVDLGTGEQQIRAPFATDVFEAGEPSVATPRQQWRRLGPVVSGEQRSAEWIDLYGADEAVLIANFAGFEDAPARAASVAQIFDAAAPAAVREQALYDLFTSSEFQRAGLRGSDTAFDVLGDTLDVSVGQDRASVTGSFSAAGRGGAVLEERFTFSLSRGPNDVPAVMVGFGGGRRSAARDAAQQGFLRNVERYAIANGASTVRLDAPSAAARVSAANAGYDWDETAMGGLEGVRGTVQRMLLRAGRDAEPGSTSAAVVEQMLRDTESALSVDDLPTPFEVANLDPTVPRLGYRAVGSVQWSPVRSLAGPSRMLDRSALLAQRRRDIAARARVATFDVWGDDRVPRLQRALADLPTLDEMRSAPFNGFSAVMNTTFTGDVLRPGQPGLRLAVNNASPGYISFKVLEYVNPDTVGEVRQIGRSDLFVSYDEAIVAIGSIAKHQKLKSQVLPSFEEFLSNRYVKVRVADGSGGYRTAGVDDLQREFGDMKSFRNALASTRQSWNLDAMNATFPVDTSSGSVSVSMTLPQALRIRDALWRGDGSSVADVERVFRDAGVEVLPGSAADVLRALNREIDARRGWLLHRGNGNFSMEGRRTMNAGYMNLDDSAQGGGIATAMFEQFGDWAIAHDAFDRVTVNANIDVGSYAWGLFGFGFSRSGEDRRAQARELLGWLESAVQTLEEREMLDAVRQAVDTMDPADEAFPNPFDIASLGMKEAFMAGRRDWLGKRGLIGNEQTMKAWNGMLVLRPDRIYHQARTLRQVQRMLEEQAAQARAGRSEPVGPVSRAGLSEVEALALAEEFGIAAGPEVGLLRAASVADEGVADRLLGLDRSVAGAVLRASQTGRDLAALVDAVSGGSSRPSAVEELMPLFGPAFGRLSGADIERGAAAGLLGAERALSDARVLRQFRALPEQEQQALVDRVAQSEASLSEGSAAVQSALSDVVPLDTEPPSADALARYAQFDPVVADVFARASEWSPSIGDRLAGLPGSRVQQVADAVLAADDPVRAFNTVFRVAVAEDGADRNTELTELTDGLRAYVNDHPGTLSSGVYPRDQRVNFSHVVRSMIDDPSLRSLVSDPRVDRDELLGVLARAAGSSYITRTAQDNAVQRLREFRDSLPVEVSVPPPPGPSSSGSGSGGVPEVDEAQALLDAASVWNREQVDSVLDAARVARDAGQDTAGDRLEGFAAFLVANASERFQWLSLPPDDREQVLAGIAAGGDPAVLLQTAWNLMLEGNV